MSNTKKIKETANDKSIRRMEGVARWASYYRENPQRFVKEYLNITLKLFQKFLIYAMMHNNHFMFWACRSLGKSWLTALFSVCRCILFPNTKISVCCCVRSQGNKVLRKITEDFMVKYGWGSDNLRREIETWKISENEAFIKFRNHSWIRVDTATDNGRGERANILVVDEFRLVDIKVLNTVLKRFLGDPRHPRYLDLPEYRDNEDLLESNVDIYMSSAWFKSHWSYDKSKAYTVNLLGGRKGYFVCALPYQMAVMSKLKKRSEIEDEMSETDFDEMSWEMEMGCMPFGADDDAFFSFDDISNCMTLQTVVYPFSKTKDIEIPTLLDNERRILSIDIALMASKRHKNDAASLFINRAIPTNQNHYKANIIWLDTYEGLLTNELALIVRRLFELYNCTDLVIDAHGNGMGVYDLLVQDMIDVETGEVYPALSCCNDDAMADRCKDPKAKKVIWAIKASAKFNSDIAKALRAGFQNNNINLPVSEQEAEVFLRDKMKGYKKMNLNQQIQYKLPFYNSDLTRRELVNLEGKINGADVKLSEKTGMRKDRYSSLAYNYWVQCELERINLRDKKEFTMKDYAQSMRKLNHRPIMY